MFAPLLGGMRIVDALLQRGRRLESNSVGMNLGLYCCLKKVTAVTDANIGYTHYNLEALRSYHIHGRYVTYIPRCAVGGTIGEIFLLRWKVNQVLKSADFRTELSM